MSGGYFGLVFFFELASGWPGPFPSGGWRAERLRPGVKRDIFLLESVLVMPRSERSAQRDPRRRPIWKNKRRGLAMNRGCWRKLRFPGSCGEPRQWTVRSKGGVEGCFPSRRSKNRRTPVESQWVAFRASPSELNHSSAPNGGECREGLWRRGSSRRPRRVLETSGKDECFSRKSSPSAVCNERKPV